MRISAYLAAMIGLAFAVVCYGVALNLFASLGEIADAQKLADAKGFAWFWAFLGTLGVVFGAISWFLFKGQKERGE